MINKEIFRGYDIRGKYPTDINEEVATLIGKSFGTYILNMGKNTCIVGRDVRLSSPSLAEHLVKGMLGTGLNVIYLGKVTTPMYYYSLIKLNNQVGMMVTASHNPKDENGFKFSYDKRGNARGEMITDFYNFTVEGNFNTGKGMIKKYDVKPFYLELFKSSLNMGTRKVKVVVDLANASTCLVAKDIYKLFPNIDAIYMNDTIDGNFPNHHPDPSIEENLESLKKRVLEEKADLGISFDGDGDRVGFVLENGQYVPTDQMMIIFIRDMIKNVTNKTFLYDVKCTKALKDEIEKLGGTPLCYRTGNSYTKAKVLDDNLPFGGEYSGHLYFNDHFLGFDSGIYGSLRMIEILSKKEEKASNLLKGINHYLSTPEIKIPSSDTKKREVVEKIKEYVEKKGYSYLNIDGIRAEFKDSWVLVRFSNTGPNITARFEATTEKRLKELENEFLPLIKGFNYPYVS